MDAMVTLPFTYHFDDYHEGPDYARFLSVALGVPVNCEELSYDEERGQYPFEFNLKEQN